MKTVNEISKKTDDLFGKLLETKWTYGEIMVLATMLDFWAKSCALLEDEELSLDEQEKVIAKVDDMYYVYSAAYERN